MARGELDQLLDQFLVLALQVQFIEDFADPADGPELLDEGQGLVVALFHQLGGEVVGLLLAADRAFDDDLGLARRMVAADHDQLLAGEQVEGALGVNSVDRLGATRLLVEGELEGDVGQHGSFDPPVEPADAVFDVFVGPDVLALAEVLADELVEQTAVDVVADAQAEDPGADPVRLLRPLDDLAFIRLAGGRQAVGEEDHVARPLRVVQLPERGSQGLVDIRAAAGVDSFDKPDRLGAGLFVVSLKLGAERFDGAVVGDDVEQVALAEVAEHRLQRAAGLFDFHAAHAARPIDDKDRGLRRQFFFLGLDFRGGQEEEVTVVVLIGPVTEHARADVAPAKVVEQAEVGRGELLFGRVGDRCPAVTGPLDLHFVGRAVDVLQIVGRFQRHAEADLVDRLGRVFSRAQGEEEVTQTLLHSQQLRVCQGDRSLGAGRDGKNVGLEQAGSHPLKQGRVLILPHDALVQLARLFSGQQLSGIFFPVNQQRERIDGAVVRQREHKRDFQRAAAGVDKRLRHLHLGHLVGEPRVDGNFADLVRGRRWRGQRSGARMGRIGWIGWPNDWRAGQPDRLVRVNDHQETLALDR